MAHRYEWDDVKAARNLRVHGVGFPDAMLAHADPHAVDWIDDSADYGEERIVLIGQCRGTILTVVFTIRAEAIRIISARKATRHEREHYYRQTSR